MKAVTACLTIFAFGLLRWAGASNSTSSSAVVNHCKRNLVNNSFMEAGYTGYWSPITGGALGNATGVRNSKAIRYSNRTANSDGVAYHAKQLMDLSCLSPGATYEISAYFKLFNRTDGSPAACNPSKDCPKVRVLLQDKANRVIIQKYLSGYVLRGNVWNRVGYNRFRQTFALPDSTAWDGTVKVWKIHVRNFPKEYDIAIDNFRLRKLDR